jgi:serine/threonine-protein kinase
VRLSGPKRDVESAVDEVTLTVEMDRAAAVDGKTNRFLALGDLVGDYRVTGVLGSGGMGTVYLARDVHLDRNVALKLIHDDMLADPTIRDRFLQEARAMARVRHPNVVAIHSYGEIDDRPYFVMEYVPGVSLSMWSRRSRSLTERIGVLEQLCRGVEAIHAAGEVHRDLKPSNVLIGEDGRVAVADFGLAQVFGASAAERIELIGTPSYIAPEIARAETPEPEFAAGVDVYALGVLAYELLTGRLPFEQRAIPALLADHAYTTPKRPSSRGSSCPPAFDGPILRALAKDPHRRTRSAAMLRRELVAANAGSEESGPRKMLLADDDSLALQAMRELLESEFPDAEITCVTDASTAMSVAHSEVPDVVITDLNMPNGGGRELTAALRRDPVTKKVPIIVTTGYGGATDWQALREMGADRFMVKPIDIDSLLTMIRSVTRSK